MRLSQIFIFLVFLVTSAQSKEPFNGKLPKFLHGQASVLSNFETPHAEALAEMLMEEKIDVFSIVRYLETHPNLYHEENGDGATMLMWIIHEDSEILIKKFLENGADFYGQDRNKLTPICMAAHYGKVIAVRMFLQQGADPNYRCPYSKTKLLPKAASSGNLPLVKLLLSYGANVDMNGKVVSDNPVKEALYSGHFHVLRFFLESGFTSDLEELEQVLDNYPINSKPRSDEDYIAVRKILDNSNAPIN